MIFPEESVFLGTDTLGEFIYERLKAKQNKNFEFMIDLSKPSSLTYQDVLQYSTNLAVNLEHLGMKQNDVLGIFAENCWESTVTILAAWNVGISVAFMNPNFIKSDLDYALKVNRPKILFTTKNKLEQLEDSCSFLEAIVLFDEDVDSSTASFQRLLLANQIRYQDYKHKKFNPQETVACMMSSSGTTGLPKAVMLTHDNLKWVIHYMESPNAMHFNSKTTTLLYLPLFHIMGLMIFLGIISCGGKVVIMKKFRPDEFLSTIEKHQVNSLFVVPPVLQFLAKNSSVLKHDLTCVKQVHCGGAPASKDIEVEVTKRLKGAKVRQIYGMTEASGAVTAVPLNENRYGSVGKAFKGLSIKIVEPATGQLVGPNCRGEIWIKGPAVMKGYLKNPEETSNCMDEYGFLHSGDIGYYDADGFIFVVDRIKELIKYKAFQVAPAELEALIIKHKSVKDVGIVGKPDERCGELPTAFIVRQPGEHVTERDIYDYVAEHFSHEKHIHGGVYFVNEIPKTPSGKILRRKLKEFLERI